MPTGHQARRAGGSRGSKGDTGAVPLPRAASKIAVSLPPQQGDVEDACHRLRQPLQSLVLLQSILARTVQGEGAAKLVARMDAALGVMTSIVHDLAHGSSNAPSAGDATQNRQAPQKHFDGAASVSKPDAQAETEMPRDTIMFVVDDDAAVRDAIAGVLEDDGYAVHQFDSCEAFLKCGPNGTNGCLLVDAYLPGMSGIELLQQIQHSGHTMPAIMMTGNSDVPMAVQAMKAGAVDFMEKPIGREDLLACIARAVEHSRDQHQLVSWQQDAATQISGLTARQHEIMDMVLAGQPSKNIAADLGISQRTVENHRASIMKRTGAKSLPALARLAVAAAAATPDLQAPTLPLPASQNTALSAA